MDKKNITVVQGDGKDLDISPAYDHLPGEKTNKQDKPNPQDIVIPKTQKKTD